MSDNQTHIPFHGWPIERLVPVLGGAVVTTGLVLGEIHSPRWRLLAGFAAANLALYGTVGWCPASLALHRLGVPSLRSEPPRAQ